MGRHGWTFCLGLLVGGPAAAQPPAAGEPSPPAPDLPGVVVAQSTEAKPLVAPDQKPPAADPGQAAPESAQPDAAVVAPPGLLAAPAVVGAAPQPCGTARRSDKPTFDAIWDWCSFRSRAKSSHYPTPYYPPLQAWFPCEPRWLPVPCASPGLAAPCCGPRPALVAPGPTAPVLAPGPTAPFVATEPPQAGCPAPPTATDVEVLSGFMKTGDGLLFVPGTSPMAAPTKQIHRVSHWRPK